MNQVAIFKSTTDLNEWLANNGHYEIINIQFQINSPSVVCTFMVWYKK